MSESTSELERFSYETSFENLFKGSKLNKKENIELLQTILKSSDVPSQCLLQLVDGIGSKKLRISTRLKLLTCIVPNSNIPEDVLLRMTFFLSDPRFDLIIKIEILKWMVETIPFLLEPHQEKFHFLYEIILRLLKYEVLHPYIIRLLNLISTKNLVTSERIKYIVNLKDEHEHQEYFILLLSIYSKLQPKLVKEILPGYTDTVPDTQLIGYEQESSDTEENCDNESLKSLHIMVKESSADEAASDFTAFSGDSVQIPVSGSFEEVYRKLLIVSESSIQEILKSDFRRLFFTLDKTSHIQISVVDYILTSSWYSQHFDSILPVILEILHEKQTPIAAVSEFMENVIELWDGFSNFHVVLDILSYQDICCFEKILFKMDTLCKILKTAPIIHKCHLFHCFSKIYQNWAYTEYYQYILCEGNCSLSSDSVLVSGNLCHLQVNEICKYGSYIDLLCDDLISEDDFHPCLLNQALLHYQRMSISHVQNENLIVHLPTHTVFNSTLLSLNSLTLENLSQLMLWMYTDVYSEVKKNHAETEIAKHYFVSCLLDLCSILWNNCEPHSCTFLSKTQVYQNLKQFYPNFDSLFIFYRNPALLLKTICFCKNQATNFSTAKYVSDIEGFFDFLSEENLEHFVHLMHYFKNQYPTEE